MSEHEPSIAPYHEQHPPPFFSGDHRKNDASEFFCPLPPEHHPSQPLPQITPQLLDALIQHRLLVLNGSETLQKTAFARALAWHTAAHLEQQTPTQPETIPVREWHPGAEPQSPLAMLRHHAHTTIFLLPNILPHYLMYRLDLLQRVAEQHQHYVILTTDCPFSRWHLPDSARVFWHDLSTEVLYSPNQLADALIDQLQQQSRHLASLLPTHNLTRDTIIVGEESIRTIAVRLKTLYHIDLFVSLLIAYPDPLTESVLLERVDLACDTRRTLEHWYYTNLSPRDQLFALGLAMFDGLFDDQLFAALDEVVRQVWQQREPSLRAIDYCDLDHLRHFFKPVKASDSRMKIESIVPGVRRMLFAIAWDWYRRQILAVLPVLVQLVKGAYADSSDTQSWELYGTPARRDQLCRAIAETLSDIMLISQTAPTHALIELLADSRAGVQAVAAAALARWYDSVGVANRWSRFDAMIHYWRTDQRFLEQIAATAQASPQTQDEEPPGPVTYIQAMLALWVGNAAQYAAPGLLPPELRTLLIQLSEDPHPLVRERVRTHMLPLALTLHARQLQSAIRNMTALIELHPAIALSLAQAYRRDPRDLLLILSDWEAECVTNRPKRIRASDITLREALLTVVIRTYGELQNEQEEGMISAEETFHRIHVLLRQERHPFVRAIVFVALHRLARHHFADIEPQLQDLMGEVMTQERGRILAILKELYLEQRAQQPGGEATMLVHERPYPIWVHSSRPLTDIEIVITRWLQASDTPHVQQTAMQASVLFVDALDRQEKAYLNTIRKQRKQVAAQAQQTTNRAASDATAELPTVALQTDTPTVAQSLPPIYVQQFVPWFVTRDAPHYRPVIRGILTEALAQSSSSRDAMALVLNKWRRTSDEMPDIAARLERALSLLESGVLPILIAGGFALFLLFVILRLILQVVL